VGLSSPTESADPMQPADPLGVIEGPKLRSAVSTCQMVGDVFLVEEVADWIVHGIHM
jgi:hypothetical protein